MFVDRRKEDRCRAAACPGILDAILDRLRDRRFFREAANAAGRLFASGKTLSFELGYGKLLALSGVRTCRVNCSRGSVWVTAVGDGRDRVLASGQSVTLVGGGKVVISGWGEGAAGYVHWA